MIDVNPLQRFLNSSRLLYSYDEIQSAINNIAIQINNDLAGESVILLCVMKGAIPFTSALMQQLNLPMQLDYVHATRYGDNQRGGELTWLAQPETNLAGQSVLIVDDIFDEGKTLQAICQYCCKQGANTVKTAVLVNKVHNRKVAGFNVDYQGLEVPDAYVFGFGMDCEGWGRNLDAIYVLQTTK